MPVASQLPGAISLTPVPQEHRETKADDERANGKADGHPAALANGKISFIQSYFWNHLL